VSRLTATEIVAKFRETFGVPDPPAVVGGAFWVPRLGQMSYAKLTAWVWTTFGVAPRRSAIADAWDTLAALAMMGEPDEPPIEEPVKKKRTRRTT
jgi:hypothetical protein